MVSRTFFHVASKEMRGCTKIQILWTVLVFASFAHAQKDDKATEVYNWVKLDYDWLSESMKDDYIASGKYVVNNNVITGIKVYRDQVYVTVPRWRLGIPSTLNRVMSNGVLQPYPSWPMQEVGNCSALQYVQSMEVDPNTGLMWIIDNGRTNIFGSTPQNLCPPKILVYDIEEDREVKRFVLPSHVANPKTCFLNDIVLDYVDGCVAFAYVTDTGDAKLYVYDVEKDQAYFFTHPTMRAEKPNGYPINGIAISADFDYVYYSPIDGLGLFQIPTSVLRNKDADFGQYVRRVGTRVSRADGLAYGRHSLYYGLLDSSGVQRWLVTRDVSETGYAKVNLTSEETVVRDDVKMKWADTFAWDDEGNLWFTANDITSYFGGTMNFTGASGPNMYVWKVAVGDSSYLSDAANSAIQQTCPVNEQRDSSHQEISSRPCLFTLVMCLVTFSVYQLSLLG